MDQRYELAAQDVIDALTEQRNSALNELARMQALVRLLQKQTNGAAASPPPPHADAGGLPAAQ